MKMQHLFIILSVQGRRGAPIGGEGNITSTLWNNIQFLSYLSISFFVYYSVLKAKNR